MPGVKTVARPPVNALLPVGDCTYDQRRTGIDGNTELNQTCGSVIGNPALRAQTNKNQNLALEWYPNSDTNLSLAGFRQVGGEHLHRLRTRRRVVRRHPHMLGGEPRPAPDRAALLRQQQRRGAGAPSFY